MDAYKTYRYIIFLLLIFLTMNVSSQNAVPLGIHYQAVARDNYGKELANSNIDVKFSIISGSPLGSLVYQELHSNITTSKFGVFSLVIGQGTATGGTAGTISDIGWSLTPHYLKVEVKFGNSFIDMGTMQFLSVPYALYAQKSLEPGPVGPKGDPGDPASDDQTLSFNGSNLTISGGNTVNLSTLNVPQSLSINGNNLSISGANGITLPDQIQDLQLDNNNILKISKNSSASSIDLTKYLDDKQQLDFNSVNNTLNITNGISAVDLSKLNQSLSFNNSTNVLSISGGSSLVDLSSLKDDADASVTNELQTLNYDKLTRDLSISSKNTVNLNSFIGFKARKSVSQTGLNATTTYPLIFPEIEFDDDLTYDIVTGSFTAPATGVYSFFFAYKADAGIGRTINFIKDGSIYETLASELASGAEVYKVITLKLTKGDVVSLTLNTGLATTSGTGSLVGYRVN
jgi:hypothetical protein